MTTWSDVERLALSLPDTSAGEAHEGSPAFLVGSRQFARLRWDDGGAQILQFWVAEEVLVQGYVDQDPATFGGARGYSRTVVMAQLERLPEDLLRDVLVESWRARATATSRRRHPDLR